jgi:hypothetical protein
MKLVELISLAGGYTDTAKITDISVIIGDSGAPVASTSTLNNQKVVKVDLSKILSGSQRDVNVSSGDTVYLPKRAIANASWFVNNVLPWVSMISLILVLRVGGL